MRKCGIFAVLWYVCLSQVPAQEHPAEPPKAPDIVFPVIEQPPPSPVKPLAVTVLPADTLYVVTSAKPFFVIDGSADGLVTIDRDTGPLRIRGRFVEEPDKVQSKLFKDAYVAVIQAAAAGKCKLVIFAAGVTDEKNVLIRVLDVQGARPPPVPPAPVPPGPVPPPSDLLFRALQDAYTLDATPDKPMRLLKLAALYRIAAVTTVRDSTLKTAADLLKQMQADGKALVGDSAVVLSRLRIVIQDEFNKVIGTNPAAPLDQPTRDGVAATFTRIAGLLDQVK